MASYLEDWAEREDRNSRAQWAAVIIKRAIEKDKAGEIVNGHMLDEIEFEQIKKFLALLSGEHDRNGISFSVIADCLGLDQDKLNELYLMVLSMREVEQMINKPPPGYKWGLIKTNEDFPNCKTQ